MAKKIYFGDSTGTARNVTKCYIGDETGKARKILKAYIGDAKGIARLVYALCETHDWGIEYSVLEYDHSKCTGTATCKNCGEIVTETATATYRPNTSKIANCVDAGEYDYTYTWTNNEIFSKPYCCSAYHIGSINPNNHKSPVDLYEYVDSKYHDHTYCTACDKCERESHTGSTRSYACGYEETYCTKCNEVLYTEGSHNWVLDNVITAATCTTEGEGVYRCSCGEYKHDSIPAVNHQYDLDRSYSDDWYHRWRCDWCSHEIIEEHDWAYGSCDATGTCSWSCSKCSQSTTHEHSYLQNGSGFDACTIDLPVPGGGKMCGNKYKSS